MASSFESRETGAALVWKGSFCFIRPDGGGDNLFCHRKEIEDGDYLEQGARVTFVRGVTGRGPCAQHVRGGASFPFLVAWLDVALLAPAEKVRGAGVRQHVGALSAGREVGERRRFPLSCG